MGQPQISPGQRPGRNTSTTQKAALKGRHSRSKPGETGVTRAIATSREVLRCAALTGLAVGLNSSSPQGVALVPRALPWADLSRPFYEKRRSVKTSADDFSPAQLPPSFIAFSFPRHIRPARGLDSARKRQFLWKTRCFLPEQRRGKGVGGLGGGNWGLWSRPPSLPSTAVIENLSDRPESFPFLSPLDHNLPLPESVSRSPRLSVFPQALWFILL
jgi:hypothetical protein